MLELDTVREWILWMTEVERRMGSRFPRRDLRRRVRASLRGLLSPVGRKNGWQLAEVNGDSTPYGVQHLLGRARWEAEAVRDDLRPYVIEHLGPHKGSWSSTRPGFSKKAARRPGWPANIVGQPVALKIVK
jgi:SRSO17 transposase